MDQKGREIIGSRSPAARVREISKLYHCAQAYCISYRLA